MRSARQATGIALLLLGVVAPACRSTSASARGAELETDLAELARGVRGTVGIYVEHLETGETAELRADELFPTASLVKVPILFALLDRVEQGELAYTTPIAWEADRALAGEDLLAEVKDGARLPLSKLVMLMESLSDNSASLWCQQLAGGGEAINRWLAAHGFHRTRVDSRTFARRSDWEAFGWGQTTPREMARLLVHAFERSKHDAAGEELYRALSRSYWTGEALSQLPPWIHCASKQGAVNRSRSEVVLVHAPHGAYVFCVITKEQADESWERTNEGFELLRRVSALLWKHFEPDSTWTPKKGGERLH